LAIREQIVDGAFVIFLEQITPFGLAIMIVVLAGGYLREEIQIKWRTTVIKKTRWTSQSSDQVVTSLSPLVANAVNQCFSIYWTNAEERENRVRVAAEDEVLHWGRYVTSTCERSKQHCQSQLARYLSHVWSASQTSEESHAALRVTNVGNWCVSSLSVDEVD
jgi:hypothetical protein